jgi:hypothetical protein
MTTQKYSKHDRPAELLAEVMKRKGITQQEAEQYIERCYCGGWYSVEDWADEYLQQACATYREMPSEIRYFFDLRWYVDTLEQEGEVFIIEGPLNHVFKCEG